MERPTKLFSEGLSEDPMSEAHVPFHWIHLHPSLDNCATLE